MPIPQEVLDGLEAERTGKPVETQPQAVEDDVQQSIADEVAEIQDAPEGADEPVEGQELPEGFKTYEEYVADGGDPAFYRGPKAYQQQKEILSEFKEFKQKTEERLIEQEMRHVQALKKERDRIDAEMAKAKEDMDFDEYDRLVKERSELNIPKDEPKAPNQEPEFIQSFRKENPQLNPAAPDYDAAYDAAFASMFNTYIGEAEKRAGRALTQDEAAMYLKRTQERLAPQQGTQQRKPSKVAPSKASGVKKGDPLAKMDAETKALYDRWASNPKFKGAAERLKKQYEDL